MRKFLVALLLLSVAFSTEITLYYGSTCLHCANTKSLLIELSSEYTINLVEKEVSSNTANRAEMFGYYRNFGLDPNVGGVPTLLVEEKALIIGELTDEQWRMLLDACKAGECPSGVFTRDNIVDGIKNGIEGDISAVEEIGETDPYQALTLWGLVAAAAVDSINPCTIAVMVMLMSLILISGGRRKMLLAGGTFTLVIFICYILLGLGILQVLGSPEVTNAFFTIATVGLFFLAIMELNAYFSYKPGFFAVEMPMWLRPHAKKVIGGATSIPGVAVAAVFCSMFLLPCSSGPYLVVLAIISKAVTLNALLYLVLYNVIFVLPMLAITLGIYFGYTTVEKIGEAKEKYIRQIHLVSGIVLFVLFWYMAATHFM